MLTRLSIAAVSALAGIAVAAARAEAPRLSGGAGADALHAAILPQADEDAWAQIPWEADLWRARIRAADEGKPIFLWEMDGNPLGCT